jgi:hypothetical protein
MELVYALGALFAAIPALAAAGLYRIGRVWARLSIATAVAWLLLAPVFFFVPEGWNGAYERGLGLIIVGWTAMLSWLLLQAGIAERRKRA